MTDGAVNIGSFNNLSRYYKKLNKEIPVYSITFGNASETELSRIATLTNAKVFDGKKDLLKKGINRFFFATTLSKQVFHLFHYI